MLLEQGENEYINLLLGKKVEKPCLSKIYEWYQDDFSDNEKGVLVLQQKYAKASWANFMNEDELGSEYLYDWRLNES